MDKIINISIEDIKPLIYFIISMFEQTNEHIQGTSSKSDLLGGYIDRWINKISESLIFNKFLLKDKLYKTITDYFIYPSNAAKNAPDILGIKDNKHIIKFTEFDEDKWCQHIGMPFIEIKTFRKSQKMISVREAQFNENHYYVIVESEFNKNYLKALFKSCFFDKSIHKKIIMDETFIKNNSKNNIKQPNEIKENNKKDVIGKLKLLSIIKGKDLKKVANKCDAKESIYYIKDIPSKKEKIIKSKSNKIINKKFNEVFEYNKGNGLYSCKWNGGRLLNIRILNSENIIVKKKNKSSFYIKTIGECSINGFNLTANKIYYIPIEKFERNSKWIEYIAHKDIFNHNIDRTKELLDKFDKIYYKYNIIK